MLEFSENLDLIAPALVDLQTEVRDIQKTLEGMEKAWRYANFQKLMADLRPMLNKRGLVMLQPPTNTTAAEVQVTTVLLHASGQFVKSTATMGPVKVQKGGPGQAYGAAVSFLRRYSCEALLGIVEANDLDGQGLADDDKRDERKETKRERQRTGPTAKRAGNGNGKRPPPPADENAARNAALQIIDEAQRNCTTKAEVRTLFAQAKREGCLAVEFEHGTTMDLLKAVADDLPEAPPA